jgi:hypothetical protein
VKRASYIEDGPFLSGDKGRTALTTNSGGKGTTKQGLAVSVQVLVDKGSSGRYREAWINGIYGKDRHE